MIDPSEEPTFPGLPKHEEPPPALDFEVFHADDKPTGLKGATYSKALDLAVQLMRDSPELKHVKVMEKGKRNCGGVWRNPLEGRLIKSKELG